MLSFDAEALSSHFAQYNVAIWPAQAVAWLAALLVVWLAVKSPQNSDRLIGAALAAAWLWCGAVFHLLFFAQLNFMAPLYGGLFILQALLLAWSLAFRDKVAFQVRPGTFAMGGFLVVLFALLLVPAISIFADQSWDSVRLVGVAPGPTAVFTLGLFLLARGRVPLYLTVIPLLWTLLAGFTAWRLMIPEDLLSPLVGLGAAAAIVLKNRRLAQGGAKI